MSRYLLIRDEDGVPVVAGWEVDGGDLRWWLDYAGRLPPWGPEAPLRARHTAEESSPEEARELLGAQVCPGCGRAW